MKLITPKISPSCKPWSAIPLSLFALVAMLWPQPTRADSPTRVAKTLRVDHGRPFVVVSRDSVLVLEFLKEPATARVAHAEPDIRHCRAHYVYKIYNGTSGAITNGEGSVEEIYRTVSVSEKGREIKDAGSRVGIDAGEFHLWWSEGTAGMRSWVYYRTDSPVRFIQQPQAVTFESVDAAQLERYRNSRNVAEFVSAGRSVQVIGPAEFSGDLPIETPTSARIDSGRIVDGSFELKLVNLATNKHYIIESSLELKSGSWAPVHTFIANEPVFSWSDPLSKDVDVTFYRIRQAAY